MSEVWFQFSVFFEKKEEAQAVYKGLRLALEEKWDDANEYFEKLNVERMFKHSEKKPCESFFNSLRLDGKMISGAATHLEDKSFFRSLNQLGGKKITVDVDNSATGGTWFFGFSNGRKVKQHTVIKALAKEDPKFAFILAIGKNKANEALKIFETGVDPNVMVYGLPALICAARMNRYPLVEALVDAGADLDSKDNRKIEFEDYRYQNTALHYLFSVSSFNSTTIKILKLLIERGADVNATNFYGETPLHLAARRKNKIPVGLLLDAGADINARDRNGATPVFKLARRSDAAASDFKWFVERGADLAVRDDSGSNVLWHVTRDDKLAEFLKTECGLALCAPENAYKGDFTQDLGTCIMHNDTDKFDELLARSEGSDLDAPDDHGWTPLVRCAFYQNPDYARTLISKGADVNAQNGIALTWAARSNALEVARLLIENGADVRLKENDKIGIFGKMVPGRDAMHHAIERKAVPVARLLSDNGWKRDVDEMTYALNDLVCLEKSRDCVEKFLQLGADANKLVYGCQSNAVLKAVHAKNLENVKVLHQNGGVISGSIETGRGITTALHIAASVKKNTRLIEFLLDNGADIDAKNSIGITPVMAAIFSGCIDNVKMLVEKNADLSILNSSGKNVFHIAKGKKRILKYLDQVHEAAPGKLQSQFDRNEIKENEHHICLYSKNSKLQAFSTLTAHMRKRGWRIVMLESYSLKVRDSRQVGGRFIGCREESYGALKKIVENQDWERLDRNVESNLVAVCCLDNYSDWDYESHMIQEGLDRERETAKKKLKPEALDFLFSAKSFYMFERLGGNALSREFAFDMYSSIGCTMKAIEINWKNYQYRVI